MTSHTTHTTSTTLLGASLLLLGAIGCGGIEPIGQQGAALAAPTWQTATFDSANEVLALVNGKTGISVSDFRVSALGKPGGQQFIARYRTGPASGSWGWKKATSLADATSFLNSSGAYTLQIKDARIAVHSRDYWIEYTIFYQASPLPGSKWGTYSTTIPNNAISFLEGTNSDSAHYATAHFAAYRKHQSSIIDVFYRVDSASTDKQGWKYKLAYSTDDTDNYVNGTGGYSSGPMQKAFDITSSLDTVEHIFSRRYSTLPAPSRR